MLGFHHASIYTWHSSTQMMPLNWWPTGLHLSFFYLTYFFFFTYSIHCCICFILYYWMSTFITPCKDEILPTLKLFQLWNFQIWNCNVTWWWPVQRAETCSNLNKFREALLLWKSNKYDWLTVHLRERQTKTWAWPCACVCVHVPLLIQHATFMHHTVISFVVPLAPPHFSTLSHKWHNFLEKSTEYKMCFYFLCNFHLKHFSF